MSLSSENMMKLMAYTDGELEGAERTEAELLLASDVDAVRFVEQITGLGELVELGYEAKSGKAVASFDVADSVMALAAKEAKESKGGTVTSIASARKAKAADTNQTVKFGVVVMAVVALAASVFVFAQHRNEETPMAKGPSVVQPSPASTGGGSGVEVSTVNSPGNTVSVFYLPTANELSTSVVVWVDETGEK
jgi:anti-sigma factor RsiW